MSDTFLRIIPVDPAFVPTADARNAARASLRAALPEAEHVDHRVSDEVTFVDAGESFESVSCPLCKSQIDQDWWGEAVGRAAETDFEELEVTLPCCGGQSTLNDLRYDMPQGFARFVLEVTSPNDARLPDHLVQDLAKLLGCEVRTIWARY